MHMCMFAALIYSYVSTCVHVQGSFRILAKGLKMRCNRAQSDMILRAYDKLAAPVTYSLTYAFELMHRLFHKHWLILCLPGAN